MTRAVERYNYNYVRNRLRDELRKQGHPLDFYDPDFILGTLEEILGSEYVLTGSGVKRLR